MLFNSYAFLLFFLPITLVGWFSLGQRSAKAGLSVMAFASLLFYAVWDWRYVFLLLGSIAINFAFGKAIGGAKGQTKKTILIMSIAINLGVLVYFKYANLFFELGNKTAALDLPILHIVLPLGISFFTFTQIAYLVDIYQGKVNENQFLPYLLFVTYFPHLIAGPVLHHGQMMPQFKRTEIFSPNARNVAVGLSIFSMGLAKKVLIADNLAPIANQMFDTDGAHDFIYSWTGIFAYTFQLYFDFSGYSDMAIGLSLLFGIRLPVNFYSPYKSLNIADFWRRWHITLSQFLKDYLYVPLGGNRQGTSRRYINLMITMLLGGLWHGAGWNFLLWGGIHGALLCVLQLWIAIQKRFGVRSLPDVLAWSLTFTSVCLAWVLFRAANLDVAMNIFGAAFGQNGIEVPISLRGLYPPLFDALVYQGFRASSLDIPIAKNILLVFGAAFVALMLPNTSEIFRRYRHALNSRDFGQLYCLFKIVWSPTFAAAVMTSLVFLLSVLSLSRPTQFLYFQF